MIFGCSQYWGRQRSPSLNLSISAAGQWWWQNGHSSFVYMQKLHPVPMHCSTNDLDVQGCQSRQSFDRTLCRFLNCLSLESRPLDLLQSHLKTFFLRAFSQFLLLGSNSPIHRTDQNSSQPRRSFTWNSFCFSIHENSLCSAKGDVLSTGCLKEWDRSYLGKWSIVGK